MGEAVLARNSPKQIARRGVDVSKPRGKLAFRRTGWLATGSRCHRAARWRPFRQFISHRPDGKAAPRPSFAAEIVEIRSFSRLAPVDSAGWRGDSRRSCGPRILEGSVQRGGNRMRVNGQLIDAETGNHLWAERFDKPLADLFDKQDEIVARLAGAVNAQLLAAEARRAEQAPSPDSMNLYFQGWASLNRGLTPDNVAQARSFFDRALAADPNNVDALLGSAIADVSAGVYLRWGQKHRVLRRHHSDSCAGRPSVISATRP
jgi:hypothetical protein